MNIKDVIKQLDSISGAVDDLLHESIRTMDKAVTDIRDEIDSLSQTLSDDGIEIEDNNLDNE